MEKKIRSILSLFALLTGVFFVLALHPLEQTGNQEECKREESATKLIHPDLIDEGKELFLTACAACHGADGKGAPQSQLGFKTPPPDFTDCNFATREPDADWIAIAHEGGPIRGFAQEMPAFGEALTEEELQKIMGFIRTLCKEKGWPPGELNYPRALFTEKAFPEDEAVFSTEIDLENNGAVVNEIIYEKRFGTRSQLELVLPIGFSHEIGGHWRGANLGDVAVGIKRVFVQNSKRGSILSLGGEFILPTGDRQAGFGSGTVKFEPFASFGQRLPAGAFIHLQAGAEFPFNNNKATEEAFLRGVLGKTFTEGKWGRSWSPMFEILGSQDLVSGTEVHWDFVPQVQVSLNQRQHIMLNAGLKMPLDDQNRDVSFVIYLLWEWFDGGFLEGW